MTKTPCKSGIVRSLGWARRDGTMIQICDMEDDHLINAIRLVTTRIMGVKMVSGITSVSTLMLEYLNDEAKDRGLKILQPGDNQTRSED